MKKINKVLSEKAEIINQTLREIMNIENPVSETLLSSMQYSLFSGGKRIRPVLTLLVAEMMGGNTKAASKIGAALEMIHSYSLIHDDLPVMDDDDFRRGQPCNHKVYGSGIAILAGDGLLTHAFHIISKVNLSPDKLIKVIQIISQKAGIQGMVAGQVLDLEGEDKDFKLHDLEKIHENKTGAMFVASVLAGAYCGNPDSEQIKALKKYGQKIGLLFQITDDILDITADEEILGKDVGSDLEKNKATYPELLGLKEAQKEAQKIADDAKKAISIFGESAINLNNLIDFVLERNS